MPKRSKEDNEVINSAKEEQEEEVEVQATSVFYRNQMSDKSIVVNRGGGSSSKSHSIAQLILHKFFTEDRKAILILRKSLPSLRVSVYKLIKDLAIEYGLWGDIVEEKVHMNWYYNGSMIHFGSVDNPEKIKCYHPDTDIFTKEGWKNIKDVKLNELVATMNPETRNISYAPVSNVFEYDYEGDMISPESTTKGKYTYTGFCVTPNHNMLYSTRVKKELRLCRADELPSGFDIPQQGNWDLNKEAPLFFEIPKKDWTESTGTNLFIYKQPNKNKQLKNGLKSTVFPMKVWLQFLGWYLSEGNISSDYTVFLSQIKPEGREKIKKVLQELNYGYTETKWGFSVNGKDLVDYLKQFGLCYDKFIPRELLDLPASHLQLLFDSLVAGDGYITKTGRICYGTSSKRLADDVSELSIKLGYVPSMKKMNLEKYYKGAAPFWSLSITKRQGTRVCKTKRILYKGKVNCVEVQPYHTLLTRYNGKISWCGNSTEWSYIWIEEATDLTYDEFQVVRLRLRGKDTDGIKNQIFLSFNPIDEFHWIKTKLLDDPTYADEIEEIVSSYKDNPFTHIDYVKVLEKLIEQDINYYNVYALGNWGKLENIIYSNWDIVEWAPDLSSVETVFYGLDFGYNDPTSLLEERKKGKELWERELLYAPKLTNEDLIYKLQTLIPPEMRKYTIYADAAEPDRIMEIKRAGFRIKPAIKLIQNGIDQVKRYRIHILSDSLNCIKESRAYAWRKDRDGNVTDEPIDFLNHAMDARRYGIHTHLRGSEGKFRVRWL